MYHPTTRVLAVLELLQNHGRLSGADLAARLGVDGRTLRRYIATLEEMGIPITAERGRYGGYALVAGFKLPPMMFNDDEALALAVGLKAARELGLAEAAPAVASARAKLERALPVPLKERVRAVDERVSLDLAAVATPEDREPDSNSALGRLSAAAQAQRRTHLAYRSADGRDSEREFDPYGLAYRGGAWYAVGYCHLRRDLRSFRLDRVRAVELLAPVFQRPADFDALDYLRHALAVLPRRHTIEVLLATSLEQAQQRLFDTIGLFEQRPGGVYLTCQADDLDWFARELCRLPFPFRILAPSALVDTVRAQLAAVAACLDSDDG